MYINRPSNNHSKFSLEKNFQFLSKESTNYRVKAASKQQRGILHLTVVVAACFVKCCLHKKFLIPSKLKFSKISNHNV